MTNPTNHQASVIQHSVTDPHSLGPTRQGWWGIAFVLLNLICQGALALPETTHTTSFIAAYYKAHRAALTLTQLGELSITVLIWRWVLALGASQHEQGIRQKLGWCSWAIIGSSHLTTAPVLALTWLPDQSEHLTRGLATWTDVSDVVLFVVVASVGLICTGTSFPGWMRISGLILTLLSIGRVALYFVHSKALDNWAALAFMAFIVATSIRLLRRRRPALEAGTSGTAPVISSNG
jgi:hypothetical protein